MTRTALDLIEMATGVPSRAQRSAFMVQPHAFRNEQQKHYEPFRRSVPATQWGPDTHDLQRLPLARLAATSQHSQRLGLPFEHVPVIHGTIACPTPRRPARRCQLSTSLEVLKVNPSSRIPSIDDVGEAGAHRSSPSTSISPRSMAAAGARPSPGRRNGRVVAAVGDRVGEHPHSINIVYHRVGNPEV